MLRNRNALHARHDGAAPLWTRKGVSSAPGPSGRIDRLHACRDFRLLLLSWLPQLVADAGFPPSTASLVSATAALVGVAAGLIFGALGARIGPVRLASSAKIGFGGALAYLAGVMFAAGLTRSVVSLAFAAIACAAGLLPASASRILQPLR